MRKNIEVSSSHVAQLVRVFACTPKGCGFDPHLGYVQKANDRWSLHHTPKSIKKKSLGEEKRIQVKPKKLLNSK